MSSSIKINSISIDLAGAANEINMVKCDHFSIRGFVAETRERDHRKCWPFSEESVTLENQQSYPLPSLSVPKFRWWRCMSCIKDINADGTKGLHANSTSISGEKLDETSSVIPSQSKLNPLTITDQEKERDNDIAGSAVVENENVNCERAHKDDQTVTATTLVKKVHPPSMDASTVRNKIRKLASREQVGNKRSKVSKSSTDTSSWKEKQNVTTFASSEIAGVVEDTPPKAIKNRYKDDKVSSESINLGFQRRKTRKVRLLSELIVDPETKANGGSNNIRQEESSSSSKARGRKRKVPPENNYVSRKLSKGGATSDQGDSDSADSGFDRDLIKGKKKNRRFQVVDEFVPSLPSQEGVHENDAAGSSKSALSKDKDSVPQRAEKKLKKKKNKPVIKDNEKSSLISFSSINTISQSTRDLLNEERVGNSLDDRLAAEGYFRKPIPPQVNNDRPVTSLHVPENAHVRPRDVEANSLQEFGSSSRPNTGGWLRTGVDAVDFSTTNNNSTDKGFADLFSVLQKEASGADRKGKTVMVQEHHEPLGSQSHDRNENTPEEANDDITLEIAELMAKNQYERCLPDKEDDVSNKQPPQEETPHRSKNALLIDLNETYDNETSLEDTNNNTSKPQQKPLDFFPLRQPYINKSKDTVFPGSNDQGRFQLLRGSNSMKLPLKEMNQKRKAESSSNASALPPKNSSGSFECIVNRNPADFTVAEPGNERKLMHNLRQYTVPLQRYMALMDLQERNERLFYKLLIDNVEELLPVVYTPTVGEACQKYGSIFRKPQGLYISLNEKGKILEVLKNWPQRGIQVIVVTDGERILGLGDLGCQGMGIPVGKLSLYTALGGIRPSACLPITIDVGTNNQKLLDDEFYIGLKQRRATGQEYADFLHEFMCAVKQNYGEKVLVQFEDFANHNAFDLLSKYMDSHLVFNDDIQGTASVVLAGLIAAQKVLGKSLADNTFLFLGAGEAGTGIAELIALKISKETGAPIEETRKKIWLVDSKGLIVSSRKESLQHFKQPWAHEYEPVKDLIGAVNAIKPTVLIGTSGVGQTFTKEVVEAMATNNEKPLILALSNPTSQAECTAEQAYTWTEGRAIFGSGSPFDPVEYNGKTYLPGQANNCYIFPGLGLGLIMSGAIRVRDDMLLAASEALAAQVTEENFANGLIYPPFSNIREISANIAASVAATTYDLGLASNLPRAKDLVKFAESCMYSPEPFLVGLIKLKLQPMALNPQLMPNGMPVPFVNEMFVLVRDGVEFEVDKIPGGHGGHVKAKGVIYLSNIRMVFVASKPVENFVAFDMPMLYIHAEKFNQPIFHCNNISGQVEPVVPENEHRALYSTHSFKILFKEGGCGTFVPLFLNLISSVRQYNRQMQQAAEAPRVDPLQAAQTPVDEMMRHAYVDPNDPTKIYLQQPSGESQLRRRAYHSTVSMNAPRIGGSFAVFGGLFSAFDYTMVYIRKKEDPWNSIVAGAATGGFLSMRQGLAAASRSALMGGLLLALIKGVH
ncbi:unnamed protein product [Brassica napus]|uniref:Malic enzyme n=2 Tax=Brassica TaxID=3705 RepID=A0A816HVR2_BRANA|nr:unnamed protein product [Brassica napus]